VNGPKGKLGERRQAPVYHDAHSGTFDNYLSIIPLLIGNVAYMLNLETIFTIHVKNANPGAEDTISPPLPEPL
jgi:hypothetical protein